MALVCVKSLGSPSQEIGETEARAGAIEREVSILLEAGDGVVLHADEVEPEGHLMPPANDVHVVGHLKAVDVEMSRGAGAAEGAEAAGDG